MMQASSLVIRCSRRSNRFAFVGLPNRPKLFPNRTMVSNVPRDSSRVEGEHPRLAHATSATYVDRAGRVVDRNDVMPALLKVEADAARPCSRIEHDACI